MGSGFFLSCRCHSGGIGGNRRESAGGMRAALVVEAAMIAVSPLHECLDSLKYRARRRSSDIEEAPTKSDFPFGERGSGAILAPC